MMKSFNRNLFDTGVFLGSTIVLADAFLTTAVVAIAKNLLGNIEASFLAGVGTGAAIIFVIITNMIINRKE